VDRAPAPGAARAGPGRSPLEVADYPVRGVRRFPLRCRDSPRRRRTFHHSLESLGDLLAGAGFAIDRLGEPRPARALVAREPSFAPYARVPFFLLIEARTR
jgi:hypothetical protein